MTTISNNDIARAIYIASQDKNNTEQSLFVNKVVKFLFRKRLLSKAPEILENLRKIINKEENRIVVKISSTETLDGKTKINLEQIFKKRYGAQEIILKEVIDKKLLGGLKVEVNNEVIDFSIKNKIGKLQEYLISNHE